MKNNNQVDYQLCDDFNPLIEQLAELSELAVIQYKPLVKEIISGKITDKDEIAHIMDGMLDFCNFDKMLNLYKKVCMSLIHKYPQLAMDYIQVYHEIWDSGHGAPLP
ncbi:hypothetical protein FACS1894163_08930 [Spirochaetia bacterium]|nr:hypothetical protein FACS1894163_08930 [Spirochaetia bacterium]